MKITPVFKSGSFRFRLPAVLFLAAMILSPGMFVSIVAAQQPAQLSLADILIALRSKKVTLDERNKILADAVKSRGITFALTPEIEKELGGGGADVSLVAAIRDKTPAPVVVSKKVEPAVPAAISTPAPPDSAFYLKRGDGFVAKGELENALADYNKSIEMKPDNAQGYFQRGTVHFGNRKYDLSAADFSKVIELTPQSAAAYVNRGNAYEGLGELQKAIADFTKASELDANNEMAKTSLQRAKASLQAKLNPPPVAPPVTVIKKEPDAVAALLPTPAPRSADTITNVGSLKDHAVKLLMPAYTAIDRQRNVTGLVVVQVLLDEEGKVVSAKATSGPPSLRAASEEAVRKTRFKPVELGGKMIKASGFISYNFTGQ